MSCSAAADAPLNAAAQNGHEDVTKQLISARCNDDLQAKNGYTPLHAAAGHGRATIKERLLAARYNVDLQDKDGAT